MINPQMYKQLLCKNHKLGLKLTILLNGYVFTLTEVVLCIYF